VGRKEPRRTAALIGGVSAVPGRVWSGGRYGGCVRRLQTDDAGISTRRTIVMRVMAARHEPSGYDRGERLLGAQEPSRATPETSSVRDCLVQLAVQLARHRGLANDPLVSELATQSHDEEQVSESSVGGVHTARGGTIAPPAIREKRAEGARPEPTALEVEGQSTFAGVRCSRYRLGERYGSRWRWWRRRRRRRPGQCARSVARIPKTSSRVAPSRTPAPTS
jgi:hypothetical protein